MRNLRPLSEDAIQRAVMQHLRERAAPKTFAFAVPNGGKRRPIEAAIMKGLGVTAGVTDLIIISSGRCYGIELKTKTGHVSPAQFEAMKAMAAAGATVSVAFGLDDAIKMLEKWGVLVGTAAS